MCCDFQLHNHDFLSEIVKYAILRNAIIELVFAAVDQRVGEKIIMISFLKFVNIQFFRILYN